jgi:hypothetical protein
VRDAAGRTQDERLRAAQQRGQAFAFDGRVKAADDDAALLLGYLADLVGDPARSREREALARRLAFGV